MAFMPEETYTPPRRKLIPPPKTISNFNDILFNRGNLNDHKFEQRIKVFQQKYIERNNIAVVPKLGKGRGLLAPIEMPTFRSQTSFELTSFPDGYLGKSRVVAAAEVLSSKPNIFPQFNPDNSSSAFIRTHSKLGSPREKPTAGACVQGFAGLGNVYEPSILPKHIRPNRQLAERTSAVPLSELNFYGKRKY